MKRRGAPDEVIVGLLAVVVGLQAWWILSRNPYVIVSDTQAPLITQGSNRKFEEGERHGPIVPGQHQPPPRGGIDPGLPGLGEGHPMQPRGAPAGQGIPGQPPPPGAQGRPPAGEGPGPAAVQRSPDLDDYHEMLLGIIALDGQHPLDANQARLLLRALKTREAIKGSDVGEATRLLLNTLDDAQRAFVEQVREDRVRQGKPPPPPELLPVQIKGVLKLLEKR